MMPDIGPKHWSTAPWWTLNMQIDGCFHGWRMWRHDFAYPDTHRTAKGLLLAILGTALSAVIIAILIPMVIALAPVAMWPRKPR